MGRRRLWRAAFAAVAVFGALGAARLAAAAPANDAFAGAGSITGSSTVVSGTNVGATQESGEPTQGRGGGHTVWFTWTAPSSGSTTIDTIGSALDTVVAVYTGTRVDRLALVGYDDDSGSPTTGASKLTFTASAGVAYRIQVDGVFTATDAFTLALNRPPPPNDSFASATTVGGSSGSTSGSTVAATIEAGEPNVGANYHTIWYRWTAPSTGKFWFTDTAAGSYYASVSVYAGNGLANLTRRATAGQGSKALFSASAGEVLSVQVYATAGYYIYDGQTTVTLTWGTANPPPNDDFANAQPISGPNGSVTGDTWAASAELGEPDHNFERPLASLWYRWTAPYDEDVTFSISTSVTWLAPRFDVYRGSTLTTLTRFVRDYYDSGRGADVWTVKAGDVLYLAIDHSSNSAGDLETLTWRTLPPYNDSFANRSVFYGGSGTFKGVDAGATKEPGEPNHGGKAGGVSVWFSMGTGKSGTLTLDTVGSTYDTVLAAYTGTSVSSLAPVGSDDNGGGGTASRLTLRIDGINAIQIALDGVGGAVGDYVLNWSFAPDAPANDDFAHAQLISQERGDIDGRTDGATAEAGEPAHAGKPAAHSVWYRWIAPADGRAEFDTYGYGDSYWSYGTSFDPRIAVYRGSSLRDLTPVVSNDDWGAWQPLQSRVSFAVHAGLAYYVAVDVGSGAPGNLALSWNVGPVNDDFEAPTVLSGGSGSVDGTNEHATWQGTDGGEITDRDGNGNVWYLWRAPSTGAVTFRVRGSAPSPHLAVGVGPSVALLAWQKTAVAFEDPNTYAVTWSATAGTVYRIDVVSDGMGPFVVSWGPGSAPPPPAAPANDAWAGAAAISGSSGSASGTLAGATLEPDEPIASDSLEGWYPVWATVWYRWTAPATGTYTFSSSASNGLAVLGAFGGITLADLAELGSDGLGDGLSPSVVRVGVSAGDVVYLSVGVTSGTAGGPLTLSWSPTTGAAANDELANAQTIGGATGSLTASNDTASRELGEPLHAGAYGGASLWYAWTAPAGGATSFQTVSSADTVLAVYRTDSNGGLVPVAANDTPIAGASTYSSRVAFTAAAGARYLVAVDAAHARYDCSCGTGTFTLSWAQPPSPPNDNFANAAYLGEYHSAFDDRDSNFGATRETGEPVHAGVAGGASVWFKWSPTALHRTVTVSTRGSDFNTVLAVYSGTGLTSLTPLGSDDDSGGNGTSTVTFVADGSGPYWIAVDGKNGAQGDIVLSAAVSTAPTNDHFENAAPLLGSSGTVKGALADATADPGQPEPDPFDCCRSVWFRWTAPSTGTWRFDLAGTTAEATLGVYVGTSLRYLAPVVEGDVDVYKVFAPVVAGQTYTIMVVGDALSNDEYQGLYALNWRPATAPANDLYGSALTLSGPSGTVTQSNVEASVEAAEPFIAGSAGGASLWYRWTAPADGTVSFDTAGSTFDDVLGVYTGSSLPTLAPVAGNDDFGGDPTAYVRAHVTAGVTYSIGVDGSACCGIDPSVGTVSLAWTFAPPPANDAFAAAAPLSGSSGSVNGTTAGALTEPGEPQHADGAAGASVWYRWTAPATGNYRLDTSSSAMPIVVGVYTGTSVGALSVVRRTDDTGVRARTVTFAATAGATYRIAVDAAGRAAGPFTLVWSSTTPPNDAFGNAQQIDGSTGTVEAATVGATKEAGEPAHAGAAGGASVWFKWTAPLSGAVAFDTIGSDYDTLLGVYTGSSVGGLTTTAASDDANGKTTSSVRFDATAGTTYRVAVDGKSGATGNARLNWRPSPKPPNDDFANGELIGGRRGIIVETTLGATREPGEPDHDAAGGAHSLWFRYRAPADGTVTFSIDRSYFATALAAYTGTGLASLKSIAQGTTALSFTVAKDAVYFVAVDGVGDAMGQFTLSWRLPPANDAFTSAQAISGASGSASGTTEGAAPDGADDGNSVWYRWTAPATGTWLFSVPALQYPAAVSVGVGDSFASRQAGGWYQQPGRIGVTQGVSYWIEVQPNSWTSTPGAFTLTWRQATDAPANDGVPNARGITGTSGSVGGSSVAASREPGEPSIGGVGHSVWLRWTAPASGQLSVTSQGSSYGPYLAAYTGTTVANLQPVPLTTHITTGGYPGWDYIAFQAVAGTSYLLDVDSDGFGSYRVAWSLDASSGVWNDAFANATVIKETNGSINGTNVGATKEPGEPNHAGNAGGHSVWYSWTAPASQPAGFQTACALDTLVAVYTGSTVGALTPVASNDNASSGCVGSLLSFNAVKGTTYHVAVDGKNGATGSFTLQWTGQTADVSAPTTSITGGPDGTVSATGATFTFSSEAGATFQCALDGAAFAACTSPISYGGLALGSHTFAVRATDTAGNTENPPMQRTWTIAGAPGNDNFASAQAIGGAVGSVQGSLLGATRESGDPFPTDAATVWYTWTAPRAGIAQLGAPNGDVNVYTGTSPASLTPVPQLPANDVAPVRFNASAGTSYKIVVAGYQTLAYTLAWRLQPTNDDVSSPVVLVGSSGAWNGDNLGATGGSSDPPPISERGGASIWFRWTAPATGTLRLDTLGGDASLDTLLAVYTKSPYNDPSYQELVLRGADDDSGGGGKSLLSLPVYEGTDYLVALDGAGGATGMLALNWQLSVPVAPSAPSVALTSPADGAHVHEIVTLTADANDADGITQVDFLVNGAVIGTDRTAPFSAQFDTTTVPDGPITVAARATDATSSTTVTGPRTLVVDNTPPETTITGGPSGTVTSSSASFTFTSSESGSTFQCSLDDGPYGACTSPTSYSGLSAGTHWFHVAAADSPGNLDPTPATRSWTVQTTTSTPPDTTITAQPPATTTSTSAGFSFTSTASMATFACSLDGAAFTACTSPVGYTNLAAGSHTFRVAATDQAGNTDPSPATYTWAIQASNATPPDTTITAQPPATTTATNASFSFTSSAADATFACSVDGAAFTACISPAGYANLAIGRHTFTVAATDQAGNTDPTPASYSWTIAPPADTTPPETTITASPPGTTTAADASFAFTSSEAGSHFGCSLDAAAFTACTSPAGYTNLTTGGHTFQVAAIDQSGNTDPTPATWTWTIEAPPAPPKISSFSPTSGGAGTTVTLYGSGLAGASSVQFNGSAATVVLNTATQVKVVLPPAATGGPITITTAGGSATSAGSFKVLPKILAVSPGAGSAGDQVEISGGGFVAVTSVKFNGVPDSSFGVDSTTHITAHVPATAQTGRVSVNALTGSSSSPATFRVTPSITSFTPATSKTGGSVTIAGRSFLGATSVKFNGVTSGFHVDSPTRITTTVPSLATTGPITITSAGGTGSSSDSFHVQPRLSSFSPTSGGAGTTVTLYGSGLANTSNVTFNGSPATVVANTASQVRVVVPAAATTGAIGVTTPDGAATSSGNFKVLPKTLAVNPGAGSAGDQVEISGGGFVAVASVKFNGVPDSSFIVDSTTHITAHVPATAQTGRVTVSALSGSGSSPAPFLVTPSISSFTPTSRTTGAKVTITGRSFLGTTSVKFNGASAGFHIDSATQITATVPTAATTGPISITSPGGTATSSSSFHVQPRLSSFSPTSGGAGTTVTLYGSGLVNASSVQFNGASATVVADTAMQVKVVLPAAATSGAIAVTTSDGNATSSGNFKVLPKILAVTPGAGSAGDQVEISGGGFVAVTSVKFNGVPDSSFSIDSTTHITAHVPATAQTGRITVNAVAGSSSSPAAFRVTPSVSSFTPTSSKTGAKVTLTGRSFLGTTSVKFSGASAGFHIDSATQITATVPTLATTGPISITSPGGTGSSSDSFHVQPTVSSFSPSSGGAGTTVSVYGGGLASAASVRFNGAEATITSAGPTQLKVTVPADATTGALTVTTADGSVTSSSTFTRR